MNTRLLQILTLFAAVLLDAPAACSTLVGVLEEPQCKDTGDLFVRVLFAKHDDGWQSLSAATAPPARFDDSASWTVAFDGRSIGSIRASDPGFASDQAGTYARDRLLNIPPGQTPPRVSNKNQQFAGWCSAPRVRPLVVVARGVTSDPDRWKPSPASANRTAELLNQFREHAGDPVICPRGGGEGVKFDYGPDQLRAARTYKDRNGRELVTLALKPRDDRCDGPDDGWTTQTYFVDKTTTYLGANLELVDAGDYGAGGSSELLFWQSQYNHDGYVLFSPATRRQVEYLWSYH